MTVKTKNNQIKKSIAINEVSILRQSRQTTSVKITAGKKNIIKNLILKEINLLLQLTKEDLINKRIDKYNQIGIFDVNE